MYTSFFQFGNLPLDQLSGTYDIKLVILSYIVAAMASYIALDLTGRLRDRTNSKKETTLWLIGGAIAMGSGIWAMHFIGMLSFNIPGMTLRYDLFWTAFSLIVAIAASGFALILLKQPTLNMVHFMGGGLVLGFAIAAMHYTGMTALLVSLNISYLPMLFSLSIGVAIAASIAAIWLALKSNTVIQRLRTRIKFASALIMGLAICGMHYLGMFASVFSPLCSPANGKVMGLDPSYLSMAVAGVTFVILAVAFLASSYKEAKNQQQFEMARELGMAEISASVLHNVGNVLNSINISVETMLVTQDNSPLKSLEKLSALLEEHKNDLPRFLNEDPQGKHVLPFIHELAGCWARENAQELTELQSVSRNIGLIKSIISTQQSVVKVDALEQIVSINELLDEALLLAGVHLKTDITVEKDYQDIKATLVNKIKLFQVLSNLITNAKDAVLETSQPNKIITLKTRLLSSDKIEIQISDNGVGIEQCNLNKIFTFGFTTKKTGHGFGLHASALAVNQLGGEIKVHSEGLGKGVTFSLYIPYRRPNLLRKL